MKYELWVSEGDGAAEAVSYSFFPEENESARQMVETDARLLKIFKAEDWNDACTQKHAFLGWEPYEPIEEA